MATINLPDAVAGRTYVCQFTQDSNGYTWDGVSAWVDPVELTDSDLKTAVELVTSTSVKNESDTHIRYQVTVPAGITVPCHVSAYLTSYTAGDEEDFGAEYSPVGYGVSTHSAADVKTAIEAAGSSIAAILEDSGTTIPEALAAILSGLNEVTVVDLSAAALAKFLTTDTGETDAADGSVGKIAQGTVALAAAKAVIDAIYTEIQKVPREGKTNTWTNTETDAATTVEIS